MNGYASSRAGTPKVERPRAEPQRAEAGTRSIAVEVYGRWDALALSKQLSSYHSFLVEHHAGRWVVHARTPGCRGEELDDALRAVDDWAAQHGLDRVSCQVDGTKRR
jgi:hypothetical protein